MGTGLVPLPSTPSPAIGGVTAPGGPVSRGGERLVPPPERLAARLRAGLMRLDPLGIVGLLIVILIWWGTASLGVVPQIFLPAPGRVASTIVENFFSSPYLAGYYLGDGGLFGSLIYTVTNVFVALVVGSALGVVLGFATIRSGTLRAVLDPIMLTAGTIPILVTAPFFLIWFGTARSAQVALLLIYITTIIYLFAQRAVTNLNPVYVSAGMMLGASSRRLLRDVYLPGALPEMLGGIRIALAGSWGLEAISELMGAPDGIGRVIQAMGAAMDTPTLIAAIFSLAIVAVGCDLVLAGLFGYITRWRREVRL
jgi:ABC-type nitrate/sulfonate/bicarbonate transport system permease component